MSDVVLDKIRDPSARIMDDEQIRYSCNETIGDEADAVVTFASDFYYGSIFTGERRHRLAALCLHNQPFGFTRDDVEFLRQQCVVDTLANANVAVVALNGSPEQKRLDGIIDRIEALLPPE